jgi:hypothetical protein
VAYTIDLDPDCKLSMSSVREKQNHTMILLITMPNDISLAVLGIITHCTANVQKSRNCFGPLGGRSDFDMMNEISIKQ